MRGGWRFAIKDDNSRRAKGVAMILPPPPERAPQARKHLSADALYTLLRGECEKVSDPRTRNSPISLPDTLMSAFAMFSLNYISLLAFEDRRNDENMCNLFRIVRIPSDTECARFSIPWSRGSCALRSTRSFAKCNAGRPWSRSFSTRNATCCPWTAPDIFPPPPSTATPAWKR